jgi:hypothetical protein
MKRLMLTGMLVLINTTAEAQAYTTLGPAGAGVYRNGTQPDDLNTTGNAPPNTTRRPGTFRAPRALRTQHRGGTSNPQVGL